MPTRSKAEKQRIEKRLRLEKTAGPIAAVIGIAVFVAVCALLGRSGVLGKSSGNSAIENDKCAAAAESLKNVFGGNVTIGDGFAALAYKTLPDESDATVNYYEKNGVLCMKMVRKLPSAVTDPSPKPTDDMFEDTDPDISGEQQNDSVELLDALSDEILYALFNLNDESGSSITKAQIAYDLNLLISGAASRSSEVYGIYLVEFKYSKADGLLTAVCEPA